MGLGVSNVNRQPLVLELTLTGSYVYTDWINVSAYDQVVFYIDYKMGTAETANTLDLSVEFSSLTTYGYKEVQRIIGSGIETLRKLVHQYPAESVAGTYDRFAFPVDIKGAHYMRLAFKENGVATNFGVMAVETAFSW